MADEELNYRRFFDVGTLLAVRVEDPAVFDATHALVLSLLADGTIDGLRIDHPDGLADPRGLPRPAARGERRRVGRRREDPRGRRDAARPTGRPPARTGYEALWRIQQTFVDPGGAAVLGAVMHRLTGDTSDAFPAMAEQAKREIVDGPLYAEVHRLTSLAADICHDDLRLRDHTWRALEDCLIELLVAFDRYRAYVVPGEPVHPRVARGACRRPPRTPAHGSRAERSATMDVVVDLAARPRGRQRRSHARGRAATSSSCGSSRPAAPSWPRASRTPRSTAGPT